MKTLRRTLLSFMVFTFITGVIYPLAVTGLGTIFFSDRTCGSLVYIKGRVAGSSLIGQEFTGAGYFHGRPSAINYDPSVSGGSNLAQSNDKLLQQIKNAAERFRGDNGLSHDTPVPPEIVFSSGSGLDPHISLEAAMLQTGRVAAARKRDVSAVKGLVMKLAEKQYILFGRPCVNVLRLNIALDDEGGAL